MEPPSAASPPNAPPPPPAVVAAFVRRLRAAYEGLHDACAPRLEPALAERLATLLLADAALRYAQVGERPPQLVILGPTQTGKSTLVNLLVGRDVAAVSPLAGYTVHPQGFMIGAGADTAPWAEALFPGWRRALPAELGRGEFDAYSLTAAPRGPAPSGCVLWDTPDFDTLAAGRYARAVLETAALADAYLLVLSKEKYSDLSVWRLLALLEPLGRPLTIVLNKVTPEAAEVVVASLRRRLAERGTRWGEVPIVVLPYDAELAAGHGPLPATAAAAAMIDLEEPVAAARARGAARRIADVRALCRQQWEAWLGPLRAEHEALEEWGRFVARLAARFIGAYKRDYLDHPQRYDSFRRATVALLELLEIPHVSGFVSRARRVVTWPARQALATVRGWWRVRRPAGPSVHSLSVEAGVLVDTLHALLAELQRDVARRAASGEAGTAVWQALLGWLEAEDGRLRTAFDEALQTHHVQVQTEIEIAARSLFEELRKQPARLNTLRAARATIDVGSLLLLVKMGGMSLLDVVWAPAAFAVTSLVMEGAAGLELGRVERVLKSRQLRVVEQQLVEQTLVRELRGLGEGLHAAGLLGLRPEELQDAERALAAWEAADA